LINTAFAFYSSDPAARRVGIFLFIALVIVTIGAGVGIGVGNIAHYRKF
jgi:hypothetical protein